MFREGCVVFFCWLWGAGGCLFLFCFWVVFFFRGFFVLVRGGGWLFFFFLIGFWGIGLWARRECG